jgi:polysaccharide export outer membrane protein
MRHISFWRTALVAAAVVGLTWPAAATAQGLATTPSAATAAPAPTADYRLVTGDKLRIEVYKDAQLSQSAQIRPDGKITMPLIGDITAVNQTTTELRQSITESLKEYVNNPSVTVIVVETVVPTAYVMGEVRSPGAVALQGEITVLQALALSGGLTEFAKSGDIRVLRKTGTGVETLPFRYKDAVKGLTQAQMYLRPGDTVVVP